MDTFVSTTYIFCLKRVMYMNIINCWSYCALLVQRNSDGCIVCPLFMIWTFCGEKGHTIHPYYGKEKKGYGQTIQPADKWTNDSLDKTNGGRNMTGHYITKCQNGHGRSDTVDVPIEYKCHGDEPSLDNTSVHRFYHLTFSQPRKG